MEVVVTTGVTRRGKLQSTNPTPSFLQAGCFSCCPTNSVRALKKYTNTTGSDDIVSFSVVEGNKRQTRNLYELHLRLMKLFKLDLLQQQLVPKCGNEPGFLVYDVSHRPQVNALLYNTNVHRTVTNCRPTSHLLPHYYAPPLG